MRNFIVCSFIYLLLPLDVAALILPERSEGITNHLQVWIKSVVIPVPYVVAGGDQRSGGSDGGEGLVYRSRKFPGYVTGLGENYSLICKVTPEGEWSEETFELSVIRVGGREIARKFSVVLAATNDGQTVTGRISVSCPSFGGETVTVSFEEFEFESLYLKIVRRADEFIVFYSTDQKDENFVELLSTKLDDKGCNDWPMVLSGDSDGLCFDAEASELKRE